MYKKSNLGKHYIPAQHRGSKPGKRGLFLIATIASICVLIISGVTLAYVFTQTDDVKNTFQPSKVACEVVENGSSEQSEFDGEVKTNVRIKNTGDTQSYIRAAVVVTWMSEDGTTVTAQKPIDDTEYEITYANETDESTYWKLGADGYWYYTQPVNVDDITEKLIERCSLLPDVNVPDGFYLSVEIVASAIQSTPTSVITEQWNSGVSSVNGTTLEIKK